MDVSAFSKNILLLDGAMGTLLQKGGLQPGENPERLNMTNPALVGAVHRDYLAAGAKMILTNTFGANAHKLADSGYRVAEIIHRAVEIARDAVKAYGAVSGGTSGTANSTASNAASSAYVALNLGAIGELLAPTGTLSPEAAYRLYQEQIIAGVDAGVDAIYIETLSDLQEARYAVLAAKENSDLPVFCTLSFAENQRTFVGTSLPSMALTLEGLGVDALGLNCSVGPTEMKAMVATLVKWTNLPIIVKPNAGLPTIVKGETFFTISEDVFVSEMLEMIDMGVSIVGGCCGTTPAFIRKLADAIRDRWDRWDRSVPQRRPVAVSAVCSSSKALPIDRVRVIGERINPTGKKRFQKALKENDMDFMVGLAIEQTRAGADILDVNVGLPGVDEKDCMVRVIQNIQSIVSTPLQIDSSHAEVIESGLRAYAGKAIVNSVNGETAVLAGVLPIVKKYGAAVIGLTLDKDGIPPTAAGRYAIAERIVAAATGYGIPKTDIYIDCLTLTAGAEQAVAYETLHALGLIKKELGVKTVLGVSNISFGLPARETMNQVFLALALANGLDLPIINPNVEGMMDTVYCFRQLNNDDKGSVDYIRRFKGRETKAAPAADAAILSAANTGAASAANAKVASAADAADAFVANTTAPTERPVGYYVENGLKEDIKDVIQRQLNIVDGLHLVNHVLIPALDKVGKRYGRGDIFLPQLLQSAEAAKAAFEVIKKRMPVQEMDSATTHKIILATVKGDVHDIGKNIVKVILENYGYKVIDLGKDVEITAVAEAALKNGVRLVGLSALMTTTVVSMEETIKDIKRRDSGIQVMVGGAVLTEAYAKKIGADFYAKDAMEAVAIAKQVFCDTEAYCTDAQ